MGTFDERMAAIAYADAERRMARELAELSAIIGREVSLADYVDALNGVYLEHRDLTGVTRDHNRQIRASQDCWETGIRNAQAKNRPPRERKARTTANPAQAASRVTRDHALAAKIGTIHQPE